jgi:hypothetical protein
VVEPGWPSGFGSESVPDEVLSVTRPISAINVATSVVRALLRLVLRRARNLSAMACSMSARISVLSGLAASCRSA